MGGQLSTTFLTFPSSCIAEHVIGTLRVRLQQVARDPEVNGTPKASQRWVVRDPTEVRAMSNYSSLVGSAQNDIKAIQAILIALTDSRTTRSTNGTRLGRGGLSLFLEQDSFEQIRSGRHHVVPSDDRVGQMPGGAEPRCQALPREAHNLHEDVCPAGVKGKP